ncbi:unnamed protein product [Darwinula stevensoni]|uniref:Septin-type G domain-containing protein n=1 Tax=Darwinula stevensoni TaxID=69355 RepID=A0A7R9AE28_9CRUS|nr:unnamed protein product [Darwinula stevensoni]CAG0901597.1 unnamed protein product [Darwinula stevensoni]
MKELCKQKDGYIYELQPKRTNSDIRCQLRKQEIGERGPDDGIGKVLMLVGATGAGKSTLINGMVNYAFGVQWEDKFRLKLIVDEENESQAYSQTKWVSAYVLHKQQGMAFPYTLTLVDTPGFGDTEGIKRDDELKIQIKEFFSNGGYFGVDQLDGVGFVVPSSQARLTPAQDQEPRVLSAIREGNMPIKQLFKFNNSALFPEPHKDDINPEFEKLSWKMGMKNFSNFFKVLKNTQPASLTLSKEVLQERGRLEGMLQNIQSQLDRTLEQVELLRKGHAAVTQHGEKWLGLRKKDMEVGRNLEEEDSNASPNSSDDDESDYENAASTIPLGVSSYPRDMMTPNDDHLLTVLSKGYKREMLKFQELIKEAHKCMQRIDEIALQPSPIGITSYIEMLICKEQNEKKPGSSQRVKYLEEARKKAEVAKAVLEDYDPNDMHDITAFKMDEPSEGEPQKKPLRKLVRRLKKLFFSDKM